MSLYGVVVAGVMVGATWSLPPLYAQQVGTEGGDEQNENASPKCAVGAQVSVQ